LREYLLIGLKPDMTFRHAYQVVEGMWQPNIRKVTSYL